MGTIDVEACTRQAVVHSSLFRPPLTLFFLVDSRGRTFELSCDMVIFILVRRRFKYLATVTDIFGTESELERGKPLFCLQNESPSLLVLASRPPVQVQKSRGPFQHPSKQQVQTGAETNQ